ncbi:hypothetical protein Clacol_000802 [Clathrus columnatus]|uniref:Uncharacterized protein n=1 Tax=Clathrus columnatus TaxID=1419009 RepID=A0AAV5A1J2_9AGAM|nr:hypothetical protein Clacol_000802 [Clathrus columnatus]
MESLWKVRRLTPGAIAMTAILARFSASSDLAFRPTGITTEIEYQEDYRIYLEYLSEGLRLKKPSVLAIFQQWNDIFYSNQSDLPQRASKPSLHNRRAILADLYDEQEQNMDEHRGQNTANDDRGQNTENDERPNKDDDDDDDDENDTDMRAATVVTGYTRLLEQEQADDELLDPERGQRQSSPLSDPPRPPLRSRHNNQPYSMHSFARKKRAAESNPSDVQGAKENMPAKRRRRNENKQMNTGEIVKFQSRFKTIPTIIELDLLTVSVVANEGQRIDIPDGCVLDDKLLTGTIQFLEI